MLSRIVFAGLEGECCYHCLFKVTNNSLHECLFVMQR